MNENEKLALVLAEMVGDQLMQDEFDSLIESGLSEHDAHLELYNLFLDPAVLDSASCEHLKVKEEEVPAVKEEMLVDTEMSLLIKKITNNYGWKAFMAGVLHLARIKEQQLRMAGFKDRAEVWKKNTDELSKIAKRRVME